ncbi:MAG: hypothetical protein GY943_18860 [Chloroflexi bacterium]|nr:hypothetical protein [Chloroflexota bacterium]
MPEGLTAVEWSQIQESISQDTNKVTYQNDNNIISRTETAKLFVPTETTASYFGYSVAIDGNTVVVGAVCDSLGLSDCIGSAYIYEFLNNAWIQTAKLTADDGTEGDFFGFSVAINGDTVVVGALIDHFADSTEPSPVYVFERGVEWRDGSNNQVAKLLADGGTEEDGFGHSIAIYEDTVVVGAWGDDDNGAESGAAYVFEKGMGWHNGSVNQVAKLIASDEVEEDYFGDAVAIYGGTIVVGASGDDDNGIHSGAAYVFEKGTGWIDGSVNQSSKLLASNGAEGEHFGISVAVYVETIVVGVSNDNEYASGAVYIFEKENAWVDGSVNQVARLTASDSVEEDFFGYSVAIDGDTVLIGSYDDYNDYDNVGSDAAYVFERSVGWSDGSVNQVAKLTAENGITWDSFGLAVAISGDTALVGVPYQMTGTAQIFTKDGEWNNGIVNQTGRLLPDGGVGNAGDVFGNNVAISGDTVVVGALGDDDNGTNSGAVYVFERDVQWREGNINQIAKITPDDGAERDSFGSRVAIYGETIVISAWTIDDNGIDPGAVYVFEKGTGWDDGSTNQVAKLTAMDESVLDIFGLGVAIYDETIVVGTNSDAAYVFEKGMTWRDGSSNQSAKLTASDADSRGLFGRAVAVEGETIVIGASYNDDNGTDSGAAYIFVKGNEWRDGNFNQAAKLTLDNANVFDYFGQSVSISEDIVVVGAPGINHNGRNVGAVYLFNEGDGWNDGSVNLMAEFLSVDSSENTGYGGLLAFNKDTLLVVALGNIVHVFKEGAGWSDSETNLVTKLVLADSSPGDYFGYPAISGDIVVVSVPYDDDNGTDSGSVYVFELSYNIFLPMIQNN